MENFINKYEEVMVDGESVLIPSTATWDQISINPIFLGLPVYSENTKPIFDNLLSFSRKHGDKFSLGIYRINYLAKWMLLPLFKYGNCWQRVQIERITCSKCGWAGAIANPTEPSLYFGLKDELNATKRAHTLPRLVCPNCSCVLMRHAIWTDDENMDGSR